MSFRTAGRWALGTLLALGLGAAPAHAAITEPPITLTGAEPWEIATGADGALWFTERGNPGAVGRYVPGGAVTEYPALTADKHPQAIAPGPGGDLWFTLDHAIGKVTPGGGVTEYTAGLSTGAKPWDIAAGPSGDMWFTEASGDRIGRIDAAGAITEFPILGGTEPHGITQGPDGNMWFTLLGSSGAIGRITPMGFITVFGGLTRSEPENIVSGPDGNLWFTAAKDPGGIGRITPDGTLTEFPLPSTNRKPYGITAGNDGALWFTFTASPGGVGRTTTGGAMTLQGLPTTATQPRGIGTGPDGNVWVSETAADQFARVLVAPASESRPAIGVSHDAATVQGRIGPNAQDTRYRFEWGSTAAYGNATPQRGAGDGSAPVDVSEPLDGLAAGTTYHYRLVATNGSGSTPGADMTFTTAGSPTPTSGSASTTPPASGASPATLPAAFAPTFGSAVVVRPRRGTVTVRRPGTRTATRLGAEGGMIPVGSVVDTRKGAVDLVSALDGGGRTQTGTFNGGLFQVRQPRGANGRTDLLLRGGRFGSCRRSGRAATADPLAVTSARRKRVVRRLWGRDHSGRFRTYGRDSVATVRGTRWLTVDRCDGTLTRVVQGAVAVRDRRRGKTVLVKAGRAYLARHRR